MARYIWVFGLILVMVSGCQGKKEEIATAVSLQPTYISTITAEPILDNSAVVSTATTLPALTNMSIPSPTSTFTPTPTPSLTATATPLPTIIPSPTTSLWQTLPTSELGFQPEVTLELVNQVGGAIHVVEVAGDYAYINVGSRLVILDVSDPTQPIQVGQSDILPGMIRDIEVGNGYVYVLLDTAVLWLINVTQSTNPQIVSTILPNESISRIEIESNILYLSNLNNDQQTITLFDITNPKAPVPITSHISSGWWKPEGNTLNIFNPDEDNLLAIWDMSDPFHPQKAFIPASVAPGGYLSDVSGTRLYFYDDLPGTRLQIIDISDPENPILIGQDDEFRLGSSEILGQENGIFLKGGFCDAGSCGGWVEIFDLSNPQNINKIKTIRVGHLTYQSTTTNGLYFVATGESLAIVKPGEANLYGLFQATGNIEQVGMADETLYTLDTFDTTLYAYSITNPAQPAFVGKYDSPFYYINNIFFTAENGYLATGAGQAPGTIEILNTYHPDNIVNASVFKQEEYVSSMTNIFIEDKYGYALLDGDLSILDVSNVSDPQLLTRSDEYEFGSFLLQESIIFGGSPPFFQETSGGVHVIDVHNPYRPQEVSYLENVNRVVAVLDGYAFAQTSDGLKILEISELTNIQVINSLPHNSAIRDATITGNYLVLVTDVLELYDISQPAQPKLVDSFPLFDDYFGEQIAVLGNYLYVSDGVMGVWVLRIIEGEG